MAFPNEYLDMEEAIWIKLPSIPRTGFVLQLLKLVNYLYGFLQAPKLWNVCPYCVLLESIIVRSSGSDSIFLILLSKLNIILVYVDNILILGGTKRIADVAIKVRKLFVITVLVRETDF